MGHFWAQVLCNFHKNVEINVPLSLSFIELYEGLKLAQRGRLEDQRGTEIKFEMPDFLKREQQVRNKLVKISNAIGTPPKIHEIALKDYK